MKALRKLKSIDALVAGAALAVFLCTGSAAAGPVLHYDFERIEDGKVLDLSGNGYHGLIRGEPEKVEGGLRFTQLAYLEIPEIKCMNVGAGEFVLEALVELEPDSEWSPPGEDGHPYLLQGVYEGVGNGWILYLGCIIQRADYNPGRMRFRVGESGVIFSEPLPTGRPVHIAGARYDDGRVELYVNGRLSGSATGGDIRLDKNTHVSVGAQDIEEPPGRRHLEGVFRELRMYARGLDGREEQVLARGRRYAGDRYEAALKFTGDIEGLLPGDVDDEQLLYLAKQYVQGRMDEVCASGLTELAHEADYSDELLAKIALELDYACVGVPATSRLQDPALLAEVALGAVREAVRMEAVGRITDERILTRIYAEDESMRVRFAAGMREEWPMWRYDPSRSADTPHRLPEELGLQWVRQLPAPRRAWQHQWDHRGKLDFDLSYSPVVMGGSVYVPSSVTDGITAYSIEDGSRQWRFYADGPVRLAPLAWSGRLYFVSDDGHLYCLDAESGELEWKFRGGPSDMRLLGNERIINFWPARGSPVVCGEGFVYFTAGIWPLHGVFVYALDAVSGEVKWVNDTTSSDYVALPHGGAYGYGGLAPQGYIAVAGDELVVAGGRTPPAFFDRKTGEFLRGNFRTTVKGDGDFAVHGIDGGGMGKQENSMLRERVEEVSGQIDGEIFYKLGAQGRLFVTTECGKLYCFGAGEEDGVVHEYNPGELARGDNRWRRTALSLLDELGENEGYALLLGAGSGDLLRELLHQSCLHVTVVEEDAGSVRDLRQELSQAGMHGSRAAVIEAQPSGFKVQPYLFSMVLSEDAPGAGIAADEEVLGGILELMRPYGGIAYLGAPADAAGAMTAAARAAGVERVSAEERKAGLFARLWRRDIPSHMFAKRDGPLPGAGKWTHQYRDSANTLSSLEERVRLPLGILWFGGPSNHDILPRHSGGPRPHVVGGRQVYLGVETIGARCVYTGRRLWVREFAGIGHPFTNLNLERRWQDGAEVYMTNIPGATYIGSPFVTLSDGIYVRYAGEIYHLDPATGETIGRFALPGRSAEELYGEGSPDWGYIRVDGDFLVTTCEPHLFEDQELGWTDSYSGTSSKRIAVLDRFSGEVLWEREAETGFRHNAIVSSGNTLYLIDGLSSKAVKHLARRAAEPADASQIMALELDTGRKIWSTDSEVFGTFMLYSAEHDILIEGGSQDLRRRLDDEPRTITARRGSSGEVLWEGGSFTLPGALSGEMLIPGRPGDAICILSGETWQREQPHTGRQSNWDYRRAYGCNTLNASKNLLLFRTGYAGYYDLENDTGTGTFSGFRSGCTANMIAADGVLNALDYTRTCTCSYAHQTSLALVHMPGDANIESWTSYERLLPDPQGHGINFGAPGSRVDEIGTVWHSREGTRRRHPSAIEDNGGAIASWVLSSGKETGEQENIAIEEISQGMYAVELYFAELEGADKGERIFDVFINGELVLEGFDIAAETGGGFRGTARKFSAEAGNTLMIELRKAAGSMLDPFINGIKLEAR